MISLGLARKGAGSRQKWHPCWDLNPEHQIRSHNWNKLLPKMSCINNNGVKAVQGCGCD